MKSVNWNYVTLKDYCLKIGSGATPRGGNSVYLEKGEICLIRSQNVYNEGFSANGIVYINEESAEKLKNVILEEDDVLLNITGDSVARVCQVDNSFLPARVNQHVSIIRPDKNEFEPSFIRYFLTSPNQQAHLLTLSSAGATRNALTKGMIESLKIPKPPLSEQKAIAHILGSIDNKIKINQQMNQTLEQMVQTLFKSWFIDFDPVIDNALEQASLIPDEFSERANRRKNRNEKFNLLPKEIQNLFPSEFELTDEFGWLPKGWNVGAVSNLADKIQNGGTPRRDNSKLWENGTIPWLTSGEVRQALITKAENKITELGLNSSSAKWLPSGTTVIALYGATAGQVSFIAQPMTTNQAVCGIIPLENHRYYNFQVLKRSVEEFENLASGSAQQNISKKIVENLKVILPQRNLIELFEKEAIPIFDKWVKNIEMIETLSQQRDTLLPRLISGKLRVGEIETSLKESN